MFAIALEAARKGAAILRHSSLKTGSLSVSSKGPADYVTEIDRRVEETVFDALQQRFPTHMYKGEETGIQPGRGRDRDFCWVLDPLDGTANFIHGFPHFALSLALEIDSVAELAIVIDPCRGEEFTAVRGRGAQRNDNRIRVSPLPGLEDSLLANSSHPDGRQPEHDNLGTLRHLYRRARNRLIVRRTGSVALDMAYTAAGRLQGFWGSGLKHWDMAAGLLLVREAGGFYSGYGEDEDPRSSGRLICGSGTCMDMLQRAVHENLLPQSATVK